MMLLIPDGCHGAVAIGLSLATLEDASASYLRSAASLAEEAGARLQVFVEPDAAQALGAPLGELVEGGHVVDAMLPAGIVLGEAETGTVASAASDAKQRVEDCTGAPVTGIRPAQMVRVGIQKDEELQRALLDCGLNFISSDYSTKTPPDPSDPGFADKNAAMLIKHSQPRNYPTGLLEIPTPGYSSRSFFKEQGRTLEQWLMHVKQCIDFAHDMGSLLYAPDLELTVLASHDPACETVRTILEHSASKRSGKIGFMTYRDIAERSNT